uniref:Uncharacterized protein n=1 Tax=Steinernema glaseri TaxID=37863 RepID=A0A1I7Y489_9BILA
EHSLGISSSADEAL